MLPKAKGVRFRPANGTELKYLGAEKVQFHPVDARKLGGGRAGEVCEMSFHATDATKPRAAAMFIAKMGNRIVLEDGSGKSYVENVKTSARVMLHESGGAHVFEADCLTSVTSPTFSRWV